MSRMIWIRLFLLIGTPASLFSQNLEIVLDSTFESLKVGQAFAVTGRVQNTGPDIPAGQTIKATVEFVAPDGVVANSHLQFWNGFPDPANSGDLTNTSNNQVVFQFPWELVSKNAEGWSIRARVEGGEAFESDLSDNVASHPGIKMILPNLKVNQVQIISNDGEDEDDNPIILPTSILSVEVGIENNGSRTQQGITFPLTADLYRGSRVSVASMEENETILISNVLEEAPGTNLSFTIPNIHLPQNTLPGEEFTINVSIDRNYVPDGDLIEESDSSDNNRTVNLFIHERNGSQSDGKNADLDIDTQSFDGHNGSFRGLDPTRISFTVKNIGSIAVQEDDEFNMSVVLSNDLVFDNSDFILRQFDFSGDKLGKDLGANESFTLDWVQQLPDNYEGDFYYLVYIDSNIGAANYPKTIVLDNTPSISLGSNIGGTTQTLEDINGSNPTFAGGERPHASKDGRFVVYEKSDASNFRQIYLVDLLNRSEPKLISKSYFTEQGANGNSFRPKISGDGTTIVYHSKATDLVPGDLNNLSDVFKYKIRMDETIRAFNFETGEEPDGSSFYPDINYDGSRVVFESSATNLQSTGVLSIGKQIFLWETDTSVYGNISAVTIGNADSKTPSIDNSGNLVVYSSDANDLLPQNADTNNLTDIFLSIIDTNETFLANIGYDREQAIGGISDQPVISGDGSTIAFRSQATNLVRGKAISFLNVTNGGVGYFGTPDLLVVDRDGSQTQPAQIVFSENAIDKYGQISPGGLLIISGGEGYNDPIVRVSHDSDFDPPTETAEISAFLTHPEGEIYSISVDVLTQPASNPNGRTRRISENTLGSGGNMESREPSISDDGKTIVYSTKSSNLLDGNITRTDGEVFYNYPSQAATAEAIIVGGIGEVEIADPGSNYQNGFLLFNDSSGNGSGAIASYEVDNFGRISTISIINSGSGYQLETTSITVDNPRGGTGFKADLSRTRLDEDGKIHRIEIIESGSGYRELASNNENLKSLLSIDGDGEDSDEDGKPDVKFNSVERIKVDVNGSGGVFIEQIIDFDLLSPNSLLNTTIVFSDYQKSLTVTFSQGNDPNAINIDQDVTNIREDLTDKIANHWDLDISDWNDDDFDPFKGPLVETSGGSSFTFSALSGRVETNNPTAVSVRYRSNMLIGGSGFTRATARIGPPPIIFGLSEVMSSLTSQNDQNQVMVEHYDPDKESDDIYLFSFETNSTERLSKSKFGLPINYLPNEQSSDQLSLSNRFPALSGDGRHVFYSSDANDTWGLIFGFSNQVPLDENSIRDIYHHDRKTNQLSSKPGNINFRFPHENLGFSLAPQSKIPVVIDYDLPPSDAGLFVARVFVNGKIIQNNIMRQHGVSDSANPTNADFLTHRFDLTVSGSETKVGQNSIQVGLYEVNSTTPITFSDPLLVNIAAYNQIPPNITLKSLPISTLTDTSSILFSVEAEDMDGSLRAVQFYLNGEKLGNEIGRANGVAQIENKYYYYHEPTTTGVFTVHAIAYDNSGNYVASEAQHFTVTKGTQPSKAEFRNDFKSFEFPLSNSEWNVLFDQNKGIYAIDLPSDKNHSVYSNQYGSPPRAWIRGNGAAAFIDVKLDELGYISDLVVESPGSGYDLSNIELSFIPNRRIIRSGIEGKIGTRWWDYDGEGGVNGISEEIAVPIISSITQSFVNTDATDPFYTDFYFNFLTIDDWQTQFFLIDSGEGYVTKPTFHPVIITGEPGQKLEEFSSVPLDPPVFGSSKLQDFNFQLRGAFEKGRISGGFTRTPLYVEMIPTENTQNLASVQLLVDGELYGNEIKLSPFVTDWIPQAGTVYSLSAVAKDYDGNVYTLPPQALSVGEYYGSGITARFSGDTNFIAQVGSEAKFTVICSSEFEVSQVEFFLDGESLGLGEQTDTGRFRKRITFENLTQGEHFLAYVAKDKMGNETGTFNPFQTNIADFQHKIITVVPSSEQDAPTIDFYPSLENNQSRRYTFKKGQRALINLRATVDKDGFVDKVYLLAEDEMIENINGEFYVEYDPNSLLHADGIFTFEFTPQKVGIFPLEAMVVDSFGLQKFSTDSGKIFMEVINEVSQPPNIQLVYPNGDITLTSTSNQRLVAIASDPDDSLVGIQFYIDGEKYGPILEYDKSRPQSNFVFSLLLPDPSLPEPWNSVSLTPGVHNVSVRAMDSTGLESYGPAAVISVTHGNEFVPQISLSPISPFYLTGNDVSILAAATDEANSTTGLGVIEEVKYFVNGLQEGPPDTQFPYYQNWSPMQEGTYQIFAQARDNEGNYRVSELYNVNVSDAEKFALEIAPIGSDIIADGTKISIPVVATGTHGGLQTLGRVRFQVNGEFYGSDLGTQNLLPSGLIGSITYNFEWLANYEDYEETGGIVTFAATGGNPQVSSNVESVQIPIPSPWVDPSSAAGSIFSDISGSGASLEELNDFSKINAGSNDDFAKSFIDWIGSSDSSILQDRLDVISVYHIAHGTLHPNYAMLMEDFSRIGQSNDWLKDYVNEVLTSPAYLSKFNSVPYLVGSYGSSNIEDFDSNRKRFVRRCFYHKFGFDPTNAQTYQGSRRMLYFWESFESDYWEINGIVPLGSQPKDSPPRRDTVGPNNYASGECAVDLVFNLAKELPFEGGFPFIQSTNSLRQSYYMNALLLYSIFKTSVSNFSAEEKAEILSLQSIEALRKILSDYRYTSRFNYIWLNSPTPDGIASSLTHWKEEIWFGVFMDKFFPWIYHTDLGWVYTPFGSQKYDPAADLNGFWAYSGRIGWWWSFDQAFSLSKYTGYVFLNDYSQWADIDAVNGEISRYRLWKDGVPGTWNTLSD